MGIMVPDLGGYGSKRSRLFRLGHVFRMIKLELGPETSDSPETRDVRAAADAAMGFSM
jgi:hypothetical protein